MVAINKPKGGIGGGGIVGAAIAVIINAIADFGGIDVDIFILFIAIADASVAVAVQVDRGILGGVRVLCWGDAPSGEEYPYQ